MNHAFTSDKTLKEGYVRDKPCHHWLCWLTLCDCLPFKVFFLQYTTQLKIDTL